MNPMEEHLRFKMEKDEYYFVRMVSPRHLFCWKVDKESSYNGRYLPERINVRYLDSDVLEELNIWEDLTPEIQKEVEETVSQSEESIRRRMEKARNARKKKYENVPRELVCIKCTKRQTFNPAVLAKRIEKTGLPIDNFVKDFHCQKCRSTKGRKKNTEFDGLPEYMVCKCGNKVKANYYYLKKKAEAKGTTVKKLVEGYECQTCNPTKRGRRPKKKK